MQLYANLHTHSTHSDGVFSPAELVDVAKKEGHRALAGQYGCMFPAAATIPAFAAGNTPATSVRRRASTGFPLFPLVQPRSFIKKSQRKSVTKIVWLIFAIF